MSKLKVLLMYSILSFMFREGVGQELYLAPVLEKQTVKLNIAQNISAPLLLNPGLPVSTQNDKSLLKPSVSYLPEYARNNPSGNSFLCRLETKIEKDLPLGLWLDIGDQSTFANPSQANANVRFRFKLK